MILLHVPERAGSADVVVLGLLDGQLQLPEQAAAVLPASVAETVAEYVAAEQPKSSVGALATVTLPGSVPSIVLLVGLGKRSGRELRVAGVSVGRAISALPEARRFCVAIDAEDAPASQALAEGLVLGGYRFSLARDAEDSLHTVELVGLLDRAGLTAGDEAADAVGWARDLGNTPANRLNPARFGELAEQQLTPAGCMVTVHDEDWLREQGFGGLLAVGGGSPAGPRLIEVSYRAHRRRGAPKPRHVVLVGKGITFDTGGLNLKPADGMRMMHTDMCGGAAVLGAVQYAAMQKLSGGCHGAGAGRRERGVRQFDAALGRDRAVRRPDHRDRQHRRRGPAGAGRRAGATRLPSSSRTPWSTWPP